MRSRIGFTILLCFFALKAYAVPYLNAARPATSHVASITAIPLNPSRDNPDEDSVYYKQDFENGLDGWSSHDLTHTGEKWHTTATHALDGHSWWCGDEALGGYTDHWLQYLDSPALDLRGMQNLRLHFMAYWSCENPAISPPPDSGDTQGYDGWDGCNVWISTDNGAHWQVIRPTQPDYMRTSLFSFGYEWGMGRNIPGWVASSGNAQWPQGEWVNAEFNLDQYNAQQVKIRWAFASDPAWHTGDPNDDPNGLAWGFLVDSLRVISNNGVVWHNEGNAAGDMEVLSGESQASGDHWELTQDDAHSGNFSAHCPVGNLLRDVLQTPRMEIPRGYYTYFDFWVRTDTRRPDSNGDGLLDDYWYMYYSTDSSNWTPMLYDWARTINGDSSWMNQFHYFGPDSFFQSQTNVDQPEWMHKLNLTQFAGRGLWLRWEFRTDSLSDQNEGSGFYIDDFRLMTSQTPEYDAKVKWSWIKYPTMRNFRTPCTISVSNVGLSTLAAIRKWYIVGEGAPYAIPQWGGMDPDTTISYNFGLDTASVQYADSINIRSYIESDQDTLHQNDTSYTTGVVVYPYGIYELGYDNRAFSLRYNAIPNGHGAAVKFTPFSDGLRSRFDIKALRVRWDGSQNFDAQTHLYIFQDSQGHVGQELYDAEVTVTSNDVLPNVQVIDLSGVQHLQNLSNSTSFWVWFEIQRDDGYPQVIGDVEHFGRGHYFDLHGGIADTARVDWQIQAVLMQGGMSPRDVLLPGRNVMNFDTVEAGNSKTMRVAMFNGGINDVTVTAAHSDNDLFQVQDFPATTLRIGDLMEVYVTFQGSNDPQSAWLTFETSDQTPPHVVLLANGSTNGVKNGDLTPLAFGLGHAYPNPFNSTTMIPFTLAVQSNVKLAVYDLSGRLVRELVNGQVKAGRHNISFDAANLATGVYLYRMETGSFKAIQKLVVVK